MINAGRQWAYGGAILGASVSIAANVAHSYVPPEHAKADWSPQPGAVALAIFWPVALLVGIEILARVEWPSGWRWWLARWLGLVPVAAVAAVVSYRHLSGLLAFYGEDDLTVAIGPLAVDGLMAMATGALLAPVVQLVLEETPQTSAPAVEQRAAGAEPANLAQVVQLVDHAARAAAAVERVAAVTVSVDDAPGAPLEQSPAPPAPGEPTRRAIRDLLAGEPNLSQRQVARRLGISATTVGRAMQQMNQPVTGGA